MPGYFIRGALLIGVVLAAHTLFGGILFARAQGTSGVIVAMVSIRDAKIVTQEGHDMVLSFALENGTGIQSGVKYGVQLVSEGSSGFVVADERVYEETLVLAENKRLERQITYTAPLALGGMYQLRIVARNTNGLPLSTAHLGSVTFFASEGGLSIIPDSCVLTVLGEKGSLRYTLVQGVDITPEETLSLTCNVKNTSQADVVATPLFETRYRTEYGEVVPHDGGNVQPVTFPASKETPFSVSLPKAKDPQAYSVRILLRSESSSSNAVTARYVLQGESATVQTITLDKNYYAEGEIARITFFWSGEAGNFPNARHAAIAPATKRFTLTLANKDGKLCAEEHAGILGDSTQQEVPLAVSSDCENPRVAVALIAEDKVLARAETNVPEPEAEISGKGGTRTILAGLIILALLLVAGYVMQRYRRVGGSVGGLHTVFLLVLFGGFSLWGMLGDAQRVCANTMNVNVNGVDYTVSFDYGPNGQLINIGTNAGVTINDVTITGCANQTQSTLTRYLANAMAAQGSGPARLNISTRSNPSLPIQIPFTVSTAAPIQPPSVTTLSASGVTGSTATLNGTANPNGNSTTGWLRYWSTYPGSCSGAGGTNVGSTGLGGGDAYSAFSANISGLSPGTVYYYCAFASNGGGTANGQLEFFMTTGSAPSVITDAATGVSGSAATLNARANPNGAGGGGWGLSVDTTISEIRSIALDTTNGLIFAAGGGGDGDRLYRCALSSGCSQQGDWSLMSLKKSPFETILVRSIVIGNTPFGPTIFVGGTSGGTDSMVTYCILSGPSSCADIGEWYRFTVGYNRVDSLAYDPSTNSIYAGAVDKDIMRCVMSTAWNCTSSANWVFLAISSRWDTHTLATGNGYIFAGNGDNARIFRCTLSTLCDTLTEWGNGSPAYDLPGFYVWALAFDTVNNHLYAGVDNGQVSRCVVNGSCTTYAGPWGAASVRSLVVNPDEQAVYAGVDGGVIYTCALSNGCDAAGDWVFAYSITGQGYVYSLAVDSGNQSMYAGSGQGGQIYRRSGSNVGWFRMSSSPQNICADSWGSRMPSSGGDSIGSGNSYVSFSELASGLSANTTYWYCALASNPWGTGLGNIMTFVTQGAVPTVSATLSTGNIADVSAINVPSGTPFTLRMRSTGADSCTWSRTTNGSTDFSGAAVPAANGGPTQFDADYTSGFTGGNTWAWTFTCSNAYGSASSVATLFMGGISVTTVSPPSVDLQINSSNGPINPTAPASYTLSWSTTNMTVGDTCTASGGSSGWSGGKAEGGGSQSFSGVGPGNYTYSISCTNSSGTASDSVVANVIDPFNFSLSNGGDRSVTQGSSVTNAVTVTLTAGSPQAVSFSASGLPAGASASFSPTSCTPNSSCPTTVTIVTNGSTPLGNSTITITATGGSVTRSTSFTLTTTCPSGTTWNGSTCQPYGCAYGLDSSLITIPTVNTDRTPIASGQRYRVTKFGGNYCFGNSGGPTYLVPLNTWTEFLSFWTAITRTSPPPLPGMYTIP